MKTMTQYIRPYFGRMIYGFIIKFIGTIMDLFLPWILAYMIDEIIPLGDQNQIWQWGILMVVFSAVGVLASVYANRKASGVARDFTRDVRHDLYVKVSDLSNRQVDEITIPSLVSRLTTDTYNLHQMVNMIQRIGVRAPILVLGGVIMTMNLEPVLSMIMIATLPFIALTVYIVSKKGIPLFTRLQIRIDELVRIVRENVTGVRVIKALSKGEYEKQRFAKTNQQVAAADRKANNTMALINPWMNILLNGGLVLIIIVGAYRVHAGVSEAGKIVAFLSYFTIILTAMMNITRVFIVYSKASASAARIEEVLHMPKELQPISMYQSQDEAFISFHHVSFSYNGQKDTLSDIDFHLNKGESLGIIGATGAGKSTVISLLMRFYEIDRGEILINGQNIKTYDAQTLKEMFGVTFQNDTIFHDTVAHNIAFGRDLSLPDIQEAATHAMADDFIRHLADGYDTILESQGANLSGGQKQRILISRALAAHPKILVLDDASSALDYETDARLRKAILENYPDTTLLMIAQRVSSVMSLDHILVLEEGRIVAQGSHRELMKSCEIYRDLAISQMGGQVDEI